MGRIEFERVTPEEVGVSSKAVTALLDSLEDGTVEPHGIMIMRHGKVCTEGWWSPYAPGLIHGMQSLTKTYAATAIGIAYTEGILNLNEKIVDIFPEEAAHSSQKWLKYQTIRHVLTMSTGAKTLSSFEGNWIQNYMDHELVFMPGTHFFYNSVGSTLLGEIIRRKTGQLLQDYLADKLFKKIGIDANYVKWLTLRDGLGIGGSGIFTILENNLRLAKLYLDGGYWEGERILAEDFVQEAGKKQMESSNPGEGIEAEAGYGYQMWMCSYPGVYRMSGAMGQYALIYPAENMIIVYSGSHMGNSSDLLLGKFWDFMKDGIGNFASVPEEARRLARRLSGLSLPAPVWAPWGNQEDFEGSYKIIDGYLHIGPMTGGIMQKYYPSCPIDEFRIWWESNQICCFSFTCNGRNQIVKAGMDGLNRLNWLEFAPYPVHLTGVSAHFEKKKLILEFRWIETCFSFALIFEKKENGILTIEKVYHGVDPEKDMPHQAQGRKKTEEKKVPY